MFRKNNIKYSLLLFDADDTLFDYKKAEEVALKLAFKKFNLKISSSDYLPLYKTINAQIWLDLEKKLITPEQLKHERFRRLFEKINISFISPQEFSNSYLQFLSQQTFLLPGVLETLAELSPKFKMAIITNGLKEVQRPRINSSKIAIFFCELIISNEIGIAKPDKLFFEYTLKKLEHKDKSTVLIIGDNLTSDILGGINSGIDTCWINIHNKINDSEIKPKYSINNIIELPKLIT